MPVLEVFSLKVMSSHESRMNTTTSKILPKTLFKADAPHLRSFSIEYTIDFTLPIFRELIKLHALNINSNASPSVARWLQMLNEMLAVKIYVKLLQDGV